MRRRRAARRGVLLTHDGGGGAGAAAALGAGKAPGGGARPAAEGVGLAAVAAPRGAGARGAPFRLPPSLVREAGEGADLSALHGGPWRTPESVAASEVVGEAKAG